MHPRFLSGKEEKPIALFSKHGGAHDDNNNAKLQWGIGLAFIDFSYPEPGENPFGHRLLYSDCDLVRSIQRRLRNRHAPGKLRPALVLQSDLVNEAGYPSTIVIPTTTRLIENAGILRLRLKQGQGRMARDSDLLLGQMIAVANESFRQEIGAIPRAVMEEVENRIRIILNL